MAGRAYEPLHEGLPAAAPVATPVATVVAMPVSGYAPQRGASLFAEADSWGYSDAALAGEGVVARRDWRGSLLHCCGQGSSRDWQVCLLSSCCGPILFGNNMKRGLALDFAQQSLLAFVFMSLTHWIVNLSQYNKCGNAPPMPFGDMTPTSSDFEWTAWEYAQQKYAECSRPMATAQVFMWMLTWLFFLYAGYRRIQMRRRFGLPGDDVRDYVSWLLCPLCAMCQEARTLLHNRVDGGVWHGPLPAAPPGGALAPPPQQAFAVPPQHHDALFAPQLQPQVQPRQAWGGGVAANAGMQLPPPPPTQPTPPPPAAAPTQGMYVPPSGGAHAV